MNATAPVPPPTLVTLSPAERASLERWARGRRTPRRLVRRARIILQAAAGLGTTAIARACRTDRECVARWRARFLAARLAGLQQEAPRSGRPSVLPPDVLHALVTLLATTTRPDGRPWSTRRLAEEAGVSPATVQRCGRANGLAPHRVQALQLRHPFPGFARLTEVLGGYLTAWDSALVVGGDAVHPHRPAPPARPPRPNVQGVPARYACALPALVRQLGGPPETNRLGDWLQFLKHVAARVPRDRWVHVLADTADLHAHPAVATWLARHARVVLHLVPAGRPLPPWFHRALQGWVDQAPARPRLPRTVSPEMVRRLERDRLLPSPPPVTALRAAVARLCPRSAQRRDPASWMASRALVPALVGNPRWHQSPDSVGLIRVLY